MIFSLFLSLFLLSPDSKPPKIPPGTVQIGTNLFADQSEIRERDWSEYYFWRKFKRLDPSLDESLMDPSNIDSTLAQSTTPSSFYPRTSITYGEAKAYCQWRTDFVNTMRYSGTNLKVIYRLPTKEEFELMVEYEREHFLKRSKKIEKKVTEYGGQLNLVEDYGNKKKRIYGLFHNAAEMSNDKGLAYGMSNETFTRFGEPLAEVRYEGSAYWVGFRCVAEFVEKE